VRRVKKFKEILRGCELDPIPLKPLLRPLAASISRPKPPSASRATQTTKPRITDPATVYKSTKYYKFYKILEISVSRPLPGSLPGPEEDNLFQNLDNLLSLVDNELHTVRQFYTLSCILSECGISRPGSRPAHSKEGQEPSRIVVRIVAGSGNLQTLSSHIPSGNIFRNF
jgi:hypothetical protein